MDGYVNVVVRCLPGRSVVTTVGKVSKMDVTVKMVVVNNVL